MEIKLEKQPQKYLASVDVPTRKKLAALPTEQPDPVDRAMLAQAAVENDGSAVDLEAFRQGLEDYSGKIVLRIPRSLHRLLKEQASIEGVSLNQYMLYKLSQ